MSPDSATAPGAVIAGHRIVGTLERTSSGAAFRAENRDGTAVLLQLVEPSGERAPVTRFKARAERLSELSHPSIAGVTGFGEAEEGLWLATAEVNGVTLRTLIGVGLTSMRAARLLGEIADALDTAHRAGVPHGDVRAENVMVQGRPVERAVLVGFPLDPADAAPRQDIAQLAALLRECLPEAPVPARSDYTTAGDLVADIAESLRSAPPVAPAPQAAAREEGPQPAAAAKPPPRRATGLLKALAGILLVAAAGGAGYAVSEVSDSDSNSKSPAAARDVSAGGLSVTVPPDWTRAEEDGGLPQLRKELTLERRSPAGAISAGIAADRGVVLDPARLAADIAGRAPRPRLVRLGQLSAMRFDGLAGDGPSVLYVASTSKGAPAVACTGDRVREACAQAAAGLDLRGARPYDPAAGITWKSALARDIRRLRRRRAGGLRGLRAAATPAAQAGAASRIARAYAAAARAVRKRRTPPQATSARRRVLARLLTADRAYRSLDRAARAANAEAFKRAQGRIRRADRRLRLTLRSL